MPAGAAGPLPPVLTGLRVLVVDDDTDTRELFAAVLTTGGASVSTASSASEALALLAGRPVDVVLSDIAMPGGDGYWLVRQIRALPDAPVNAVPVVAVTAFGRDHSRSRALAAGFADHLQKPADPTLLCRAVAAAAGR
ncbi:MAG TPA: response regulator [Vicinamibacteria bacterium]|nr:response regulator [Vicinamibacteria bacterium]